MFIRIYKDIGITLRDTSTTYINIAWGTFWVVAAGLIGGFWAGVAAALVAFRFSRDR